MDELKKLIREVPDFPKPGINFYDITTLLKHPDGLRGTVDALWSLARAARPHLIEVLDCLVPLIDTPDESDAIDYIYRAQPPINFSTDVLEREQQRILAIEVDGIEWSDCGQPERIETVLARQRSRASMPASTTDVLASRRTAEI